MAKIPVPIQTTEYNPLRNESVIEQLAGVTANDKPLPKTSVLNADNSIETYSNVDTEGKYSLLGDSDLAASTISETKAYNQTTTDLVGKFLYNVGSTILTETGKVPGYLGGIGLGVFDKAVGSETPFIKNVVDNAWVNAFEDLDKGLKELVPVYMSKQVQEGGFMDKIGSGAWWAESGAQGVGFLLSMMLPGQVLKTFNIGSKIAGGAEAIANSNTMIGKLLAKSPSMLKLANTEKVAASSSFIKSADSVAAATMNTFIESSAEAGNTFDNVKKSYLEQGFSEEDANRLAGESASGVFKSNMALLAVSNLLDEHWLWNGFSKGGAESKSILSKLFKEGKFDVDTVSKLSKKSWVDIAKTGATNFGKGIIKEGFFEEGSQTLLQQQVEKDGSNGIMSDLGRVYANYFSELMNNQEMQESIFLGGVLGGGMSFIQTKNDIKNYNDQMFGTKDYTPTGLQKLYSKSTRATPGIANLFKDNFLNNYTTLLDIAEKDDTGKVIYKDGKPLIMEDKLTDAVKSKVAMLDANYQYDLAVSSGDEMTAKEIGDGLAMNYFMPFFQQEGGSEILNEHIQKQLGEAWANRYEQNTTNKPTDKQKQDYINELTTKAKQLGETYKNVNETNYPERYYNSSEKEYQQWKNEHFYDKLQMAISLDAISDFNKKLAQNELTLGVDLNEIESVKDKLDPRVYIQAKILQETKKRVEEKKNKIQEIYLKLFTKQGVKDAYEQYKKGKQEQIQELEEDVKEDLAKVATNATKVNITFADKLKAAGYNVVQFEAKSAKEEDKMVDDKGKFIGRKTIVDKDGKAIMRNYLKETAIVKDKTGKRYSLKSTIDPKTQEVTNYIYDSKGNAQKLTSDILAKLELEPIDKATLQAERKIYDLERRKQAQLDALEEVTKTLDQKFGGTQTAIEEINKEIEQQVKVLSDFKESLKKYNSKRIKMSKAELVSTIKSLEKTIENLNERKTRLEQGLSQVNIYNEEVRRLEDLIKQEKINSVTLEASRVEKELLDKITDLEQITTLGDTAADSQRLIVAIEDQIFKLNKQLDKLIAIRNELQQYVKDDDFFKIFSMNVKLSNRIIDKLKKETIDNSLNFLRDLFNSVGVNIESTINKINSSDVMDVLSNIDLKNEVLRKAKKIAGLLTPNISQRLFGKDVVTTDDVYNAIMSRLETLNNVETLLNLNSFQKQVVKEIVEVSDNNISNIKDKIDQAFLNLDLQKTNKQYLILNDLSNKLKQRFQDILEAKKQKDIDKENMQPTSQAEPSIPNEQVFDEFYNHSLGSHLFVTTGLNILYDENKKDTLIETGKQKGLPQQNTSEHQKAWFKFIDKIAKNGSISDYRLMIYNPTYEDNGTALDQAIKLNNPSGSVNDTNDLFAVLVDSKGNIITVDPNGNIIPNGIPLFTSVWKPSSLFPDNNKPRLNLNSLYRNYLIGLGVNININLDDNADIKKFKPQDLQKIRARLGLKDTDPVTFDLLKQSAINAAKNEYTNWYNKSVSLNKEGKTVTVKPTLITRGKVVKRRNVDTREVQWNNVLDNTDVSLTKKTFGTKQLQGGRLVSAVSGFIKVGSGENAYNITVPRGDTVLILDNESNVLPLKARNLTESEVETVMYLMSLGNQDGPAASMTVPLPKGVYYSFGDLTVKDNVPLFFSNAKDSKNFSLLHTMMSYGRKQDKDKTLTTADRKGEIYVATNTKQIIYVDFEGNRNQVDLADLIQALHFGNLKDYNEKISNLYKFLQNKRVNVSAGLISRNGVFPYPTVTKKQDETGSFVYELNFNTKQSYYEFLLSGSNPVLTTNAAADPDYPSFAQRNVAFDPTIDGISTKVEPPVVVENTYDPDDYDVDSFAPLSQDKVDMLQGKPSALKVEPKVESLPEVKEEPMVQEANATQSIEDKKADIEKKRNNEIAIMHIISEKNLTGKAKEAFEKYAYLRDKWKGFAGILPGFSSKQMKDAENLANSYLNEAQNLYVKDVNEKYDAELAALENKPVETKKSKLSDLKNKLKTEDTLVNDDLFADDTADGFRDKIFTPEELFNSKLLNNEIQQDCI